MKTSKDKFDSVVLGMAAVYIWGSNVAKLFYSLNPTASSESVQVVSLVTVVIGITLFNRAANKEFGWNLGI